MSEQSSIQLELPLPFPKLSGDTPLLPARMINEFQYCPRLAYLEWVQGEWASSISLANPSRKRTIWTKQSDYRAVDYFIVQALGFLASIGLFKIVNKHQKVKMKWCQTERAWQAILLDSSNKLLNKNEVISVIEKWFSAQNKNFSLVCIHS